MAGAPRPGQETPTQRRGHAKPVRNAASDAASGGGYGKKYRVNVLDLMAAYKAGNEKYVRRFLPQLPKAAQRTFRRRARAYDAHIAEIGRTPTDNSGPRFNGPGNPHAWDPVRKGKGKGKRRGGGGGGGGAGGGGLPSGGGGGMGGGGLGRMPAVGTGQLISEALAKLRGPQMLGDQFADTLAGAQFDDSINQAKVELERQPRREAQNLADIANWYGQVQGSLDKAQAATPGITGRAVEGSRAGIRGILDSLGGSAFQGGESLGAQGASDQAMLQGIGQSNEQFLGQLEPLLQAERAAASRGERARQTEERQDISRQLGSLRGQRGQAKSNALMQIRQQNNDYRQRALENILQIKNMNNQTRQQRFNNAMSQREAAIAAAMSGAQIENIRAGTWATLNPQAAEKSASGWATFANDPEMLAQLSAGARAEVIGEDGKLRYLRPDGKPDANAIVPIVANYYRSLGLAPKKNKKVRAHVFNTLRQLGIQPRADWLR